MFKAVMYAFGGQVHEKEIREGVDYLSGVLRDNIVLVHVSKGETSEQLCNS